MFKDKLRQLRMERDLTQADIAKALGVSPATIGNYEQGTREPRNNEMWQKLADYFSVSIDCLMDKNGESRYASEIGASSYATKKDWRRQFRTDIRIIYDNVDITSLVNDNCDESTAITQKQQYAYAEYMGRSGHALYARKRLLNTLNKLRQKTAKEISENLPTIIRDVDDNVVYWYKKCWGNIEDLFPAANSIETLYDLLNKCICVDMVAEREFSLVPIDESFDWLREKLHH